MRLVDGIVLVVDVVEGVRIFQAYWRCYVNFPQVMVNTEAVIRHALQEGIPITLVVNKIDRLILELRLPPADAFYKVKHTIEEVNTYIRFVHCTRSQVQQLSMRYSGIDPSPDLRLSPERGNVCFASTDMGWCFTLRSFAQMYAETYGALHSYHPLVVMT